MSRTAITLKFKICLLLDEAYSCAEKLLTDINLPSLMPDEDNNFGGSLENDDVTCNPRIVIPEMTSEANSSHSPLFLGREQGKGQIYQLKKWW